MEVAKSYPSIGRESVEAAACYATDWARRV